jgi:PDZ domain-containing protein
VVAVACAVFVVAAARVPLPYHRLGGATVPAAGMVSITGRPVDRSAGRILVTVVTARPVTLAGALRAWADRSNDVYPDQTGPAAYNTKWTNQRLMEDAGATATTVALRELALDPARVHVTVEPHGLGGPSAGLAMALEMVDLLSPGDLTGGRIVAVSGALEPSGRVGTVGGIRYKAAAARRAGADVMLVPPDLVAEASLFAGSVRVIPVASFADALAALAAVR